MLETWWESREPKVTEDYQGPGVRRAKLAVRGSLETLEKMVRKALQDSRVTRYVYPKASLLRVMVLRLPDTH